MAWIRMPFGKYKRRSLVYILVRDPSYIYWLANEGEDLSTRLRAQAVRLAELAATIRVPGRHRVVEWYFDQTGQFVRLRNRAREKARSLRARWRTADIDLSLLYKVGVAQDVHARKRLFEALGQIMFDEPFVTDAAWENYFDKLAKSKKRYMEDLAGRTRSL